MGGCVLESQSVSSCVVSSSRRLSYVTPKDISGTIQRVSNGCGGHHHARICYRRSREELGGISEAERYFNVYRHKRMGILIENVGDNINGEDLLVSNPNHHPPSSDEDSETDNEGEELEK